MSEPRDAMHWSVVYNPVWDAAPAAYVEHGVVGWGRSRRLGKYVDEQLALAAYVGVQHDDPVRWYGTGEPVARFFLSLFVHRRTISLRTYATMPAALEALGAFRNRLEAPQDK